nr:uncharacterized protein LOC113807085 [Penaeus vannamei]
MLRVLGLHPTQRDIMDSFLARQDSMKAVESVMDMMDDRSWTMRPRRCLARRQRSCPYITPAWRSLRHLRPLFDDTPLLIVSSGYDTRSAKSEQYPKKKNLKKQGETQNNKKCSNTKEKEQTVDTKDCKDCSNEMKSAKVWRYSLDVGGCDEVRAFTEDGLLVVEGRGRDSDSSVMVRHVTTLPPHVKAETLTATQKEGRLELSHKCDAVPPSVVNIPITKAEEKKTLEDKTVYNDEQQEESNTGEKEDSSKEE